VLVVIACYLLESLYRVHMYGSCIHVDKQLKAALSRLF
jgi:hypothetical protein